jgi:hypothetical protein
MSEPRKLSKEAVCPKCGNGTKQWPNWEDWQEKMLPILTRFADQSASAYNYGDVWNAIRKLIVGPMESRIKELEQQLEQSNVPRWVKAEELKELYQNWCKETKRGGGVLIGKSIGEFFDLFGLIGAGLALDATQMSTKEQNVKGSDTTKAQ